MTTSNLTLWDPSLSSPCEEGGASVIPSAMGNSKPPEQKRRRKKGRPSLLDLQRRSLRLQKQLLQQQQTSSPSPSPNPNPYLRFPFSSCCRASRPYPDDDGASRGGAGSLDSDCGETERNNLLKATNRRQGDASGSGPTTPLPDESLLVFILDRLQKKDTHGVFSEPVDPEELPDYHEIVEHPMDFGTIRRNLSTGAYANLEQFEKDVFLISSNAMLYNVPDTIYHRQARSIEELAKKNFENLRQESDDDEQEPNMVARRGRPPNSCKKTVGRPVEHSTLDCVSDAKPDSAHDNILQHSLNHCVSRQVSVKDQKGNTDISARVSHSHRNIETRIWHSDKKAERNEDHIGPGLKGISKKHWKKPIVVDENRRNSYKQAQLSTSVDEHPLLSVLDGEKQLVPVGLHVQYAYARSLARFAANLGPIGCAIAMQKIERMLPPGMKFGPEWVGNCESHQHSQPPLFSSAQSLAQLQISSSSTASRSDALPRRLEPSTLDRPSNTANNFQARSGISVCDADNSLFETSFQHDHTPDARPNMNSFLPPGLLGTDVQMTHGQLLNMVSRSSCNRNGPIRHAHWQQSDTATHELHGSWPGSPPQWKTPSIVLDLKVGIRPPGSPASHPMVNSQQPDLALQL